MHRSGTSALTGLLEKSGVYLGKNLLPPMKGVNEKGFFENYDIVFLHNRILEYIGSHWIDPRPLPKFDFTDNNILSFQNKLEKILCQDLVDHTFWGVKDPRMCRLFPIWKNTIMNLGSDSNFILIFRHPDEVAESIFKRDGINKETTYISWLWHVLESERFTRDFKRVLIFYDDLLSSTTNTFNKIQKTLQISFPNQNFSDSFIKSSYKHHKADLEKNTSQPSKFRDLAIFLYKNIKPNKTDIFDSTWNLFQQEIKNTLPFLPYLAKIAIYQEENTHLKFELNHEKTNATKQVNYRDKLIEELELKIVELNNVIQNSEIRQFSFIKILTKIKQIFLSRVR